MEQRQVPRIIVFFIILTAFVVGGIGWLYINNLESHTVVLAAPLAETTTVPDTSFTEYTAPAIPSKDTYTIFMLGDSMTHALGPHGGTFNEFINRAYKPYSKSILIDNYARSSTNILSIREAMTSETTYWDSTFKPLLSQDFDLLLIESFGYNPLSQFSLEEGLQKQEETLDETMKTLQRDHPDAAIVFVATIAPSKQRYALKVLPDLTTEERIKQAEERMAYIENHIRYAEEHSIPVINIYESSLTETGEGNLRYINPDDYIHPSFTGVDYIGQEITEFIISHNLLPR